MQSPRTVTVGLTGGIGSGKSTVAQMLASRGATLIDADAVSREVMTPTGEAFAPIIERFGKSILAPDGTIDRKALAAIAFATPESLADLNGITHPIIGRIMAERQQQAKDQGGVVVLDIPLMKADHRDQLGFEVVVVVDAPVEIAVSRLVEQRGFDRSDAEARVAAQISREERMRLADVAIDNSGDRELLEVQVARLWADLEEASHKPG